MALSGVLTKIHVIPYGITVNTMFGTKPQTPKSKLLLTDPTSQTKIEKKNKKLRKNSVAPNLVFFHSMLPTTYELRVTDLTRVVKPITAVLRISAYACSG